MKRQRWWLPVVALVLAANWKPTLTLPVPDEELGTSAKLLGSSVVTSVSVVTEKPSKTADEISPKTTTVDRKRVIPSTDLPASPADLMRPDKFQFFTFNKDGNVVTKQMTEKEIQSLIAAGGGHLPMEIHEPQQVGDIPNGGMKVSDVVQNVQNVLKSELKKPATVMTSMPTIPGHVNTEWSSILPAILGGESETSPVNEPVLPIISVTKETSTVVDTAPIKTPEPLKDKKPESSSTANYSTKKPTTISEIAIHTEKPMIQVPVITVDQKLSTHQSEESVTPVFQMLNTISAEKMKNKNQTYTNEKFKPSKTQESKPIKADEPETKISAQQIVITKPIVEEAQVGSNKVPEMIEINYNSKKEPSVITHVIKPINKPASESTTLETISKTEPPATMSVVSETHSTSIKVSGQEEVPLRQPPSLIIKPANNVKIPFARPEINTEKTVSTTESKLSVTTLKTEISTKKPVETSIDSSLSSGVSFLENLPQAVSSIVSDLISGNPSSSTPIIEAADENQPTKASDTVKGPPKTIETISVPKPTKATVILETTVNPSNKSSTSEKPIDSAEPVYQMMPAIVPESIQKVSPEISAIEHIIGALNDPSSSLSGAVATDHFDKKKPQNELNVSLAPEVSLKVSQSPSTSTSATPMNVETPVNSGKPVAPLPTELADSLTSMISQISDAMPSVLPLGDKAGLDTTEKKNGGILAAEDSVLEDVKKTESNISAIPEKPVHVIKVTQTKSENIKDVPKNETKTSEKLTNSVQETTENLKETSSTELPITQSINIENVTTIKSVPSVSNSTKLSVDKIELTYKPELLVEIPEKTNVHNDTVEASSDTATDKVIPQVSTQQHMKTESATEPAATAEMYVENLSTSEIINENSANSSNDINSDKKIQPENSTMMSSSLNNSKVEPSKIEKDDNTKLPIVRLDIKGTKPPKFQTNESQAKEPAPGEESPLVRIKLTDPVTMANNLIESTTIEAHVPQLALVTLPDSGVVPSNTIASSLIAGFPSSTVTPIIGTSSSDEKLTTIEPVKYSPEVLLLNDAPASNFTHVTTSFVKKDNDHENIVKPEVQQVKKENDKLSEALDTKIIQTSSTESPLVKVDDLKTTLADNSKKTQNIPSTEATTSKPNELESEISASNSVNVVSNHTAAKVSDSLANSTKLIENIITFENTTVTSELSKKVPENRINISPSRHSESVDPNDKILNELPQMNESFSNASTKLDTKPEQLELIEVKIENSSISTSPLTENKTDIANVSSLASEKIAAESLKNKTTKVPVVETTSTSKNPIPEFEHLVHTTESSTSTTTFLLHSTTETVNETNLLDSKIFNKSGEKNASEYKISEKETTKDEAPKFTEETSLSKNNESSPLPAMPETHEVRIQVNETAVRVTKRPVPISSSQKLNEITKSPENQKVAEQTTTPKNIPIVADLYTKLGEKIELPVLSKVSALSSKEEVSSGDSKNTLPNVETRIRLGDEQVEKLEKDKVSASIDDTRKPIKKNNDDDLLLTEEKITETATKISTEVNDKIKVQEKESSPDSTEKLETNLNSEKPISVSSPEPGKIQEEPNQEKLSETPIKNLTHEVVKNSLPESSKPAHKPTPNIKKDDPATKPAEDQWTLIPQQIHPSSTKNNEAPSEPISTEAPVSTVQEQTKIISTERPPVPLDHPQSVSGLDSTVKNLETDIAYFSNLCNELAFTFWTATNKGLSSARSLAVSPFGMTSMLAMIFLGARGPTSDQMNDVLKLDDVASFNPHLVFQNVTDAVGMAKNQGIANAAFVRELFADRLKVRKLMPFYKERAQQFYDGVVAEVNFATISDLVRRRTNLMIRKQTGGRIKDFVRTNTVPLRSPLAALSANVFQTDCNSSAASSEGRDGELYFAVSPAVRQRKLVPVPATVWRAGVLAGYEPGLDATAIALGGTEKLVSTIFVLPGQQGVTAPGDTLDRLEQRLIDGAIHDSSWNKLLKVLVPRPGLELQVPKFSHRSVINATAALKRMGLEELFSKHADLKGINGVATDLHLADVLQMNLFSTCGDENIISGRHHVEVYPGSPLRNARDYEFEDNSKEKEVDYTSNEEDELRGSTEASVPRREIRSARQNESEKPRLKLDRPFLYFVRHNPTGLILHMGRFNPRLLP